MKPEGKKTRTVKILTVRVGGAYKGMQHRKDAQLKRIACQIFTQLPDDRAEAVSVLRYARLIVDNLEGNWDAMVASQTTPAKITPLRAAAQQMIDLAGWQADEPEDQPAPLDKSNPG